MKITLDIECTPEEARAFLGLPDVRPLQEGLMAEIEDRMRVGLRAMSPEEVFRLWMPVTLRGFEQFQEAMARMTGGGDRRG
jgi:hypothetical protein